MFSIRCKNEKNILLNPVYPIEVFNFLMIDALIDHFGSKNTRKIALNSKFEKKFVDFLVKT